MIRRALPHAVAVAASLLLIGTYAVDPTQLPEQLPFALLLLECIAVGWLLAWKRPANTLGWLLIAIPVLFQVTVPIRLIAEAVLAAQPVLASWLLWFASASDSTWSWIPPVWILLTQIPLHFPDGRLPSPRWRWFFWCTVVALGAGVLAISTSDYEVAPGIQNPAYLPWLQESPLLPVVGALAIFSFLGSIASLFARYRRADATQRAQLRWMLWAVSVAAGALVISWGLGIVFQSLVWNSPAGVIVIAGYALIPIAIGVAVLRYRLYEIDRIISRTASWGIVTLIVVGAYVLIVLSVGRLLPGVPAAGVAIATLAAAAIFLPLLRLVQRSVDRRFNRAQYDADRVVDAFGARLRNGADPHTAVTDLRTAIEQTLQPASVGVWMPPQDPR